MVISIARLAGELMRQKPLIDLLAEIAALRAEVADLRARLPEPPEPEPVPDPARAVRRQWSASWGMNR